MIYKIRESSEENKYGNFLDLDYTTVHIIRIIPVIMMFVAFLTAIFLPQLRSSLATLSDVNDQDVENLVKQEIREMFGDNSGSPSFTIRGITDAEPMTNLLNHKVIDITSVDYFSNGESFNATVWLDRFDEHPIGSNQTVYGMMIDSDFNSETGYNGFDYSIEISWNITSQLWERYIVKYSPDGDDRGEIQTTNNFTGFFGRESNHYVLMSTDLDIIGSPTKYKVLFYATVFFGTRSETHVRSDVTSWVPIPPPEFTISTSPSAIVIRPGEEQFVELKLLSNTEFESIVTLSTAAITNIESNFIPNRITIPSNGESTSRLEIKALENSLPGSVSLPIQTNVNIIQPSAAKAESDYAAGSAPDFLSSIPSQDIRQSTNLTVTVLPQLTFVEKYGNLISIIALVTLVALPTIFSAIPYFYKRLPHLDKIDISDVLQVDGAVIAGALILLTLTTTTDVSDGSKSSTEGLILTQRSFITADIVFPFAISAIVALLKINERSRFYQFETRLMIAGFLNLMISIILLTIIGY